MSEVIHNLSVEEKISELEGKIDYLEAKLHALESKNPVLEMQHVEKHFGGVHAIDNFSVKIEQGQIHGLIGPNGAGKTTIFNNITGIYAPDAGKIIFMGEDITGSSPHRVAQLGIGRTFQNIRLFSNLSVLENVVIASGMDATYNLPQAIFHSEKYKKREKHLYDKAYDIAVLDITLPDGNGYDLCRIIKDELKIPVIFLTADENEESETKGLSLGAVDFIKKPFVPALSHFKPCHV